MSPPCCADETEEQKRSKEIERKLREEAAKQKPDLKVLLLGAGESGKSTILKQFRVFNSYQYSDEELKDFRKVVSENLVTNMMGIITGLTELQLPLTVEGYEGAVEVIKGHVNTMKEDILPLEVLQALKILLRDPRVQDALKDSHKYQISDSAAYFFENIDRVQNTDYLPSMDDILRIRVKTTGAVENRYNKGDMNLTVIDMGGQRSERRKWIHCFENVTAVIYVVSLSEYDQTLREEVTVNRMLESIKLFASIVNNHHLKDCPFIVFFNKHDLFKQKIKVSKLEDYLKDYPGGDESQKAAKFIMNKYVSQVNLQQNPNKKVYQFITCATDSTQIKSILLSVEDILLGKALAQVGMF